MFTFTNGQIGLLLQGLSTDQAKLFDAVLVTKAQDVDQKGGDRKSVVKGKGAEERTVGTIDKGGISGYSLAIGESSSVIVGFDLAKVRAVDGKTALHTTLTTL